MLSTDRRTFLVGAALVGASGALSARTQAAATPGGTAPPRKRAWKKAVKFGMVQEDLDVRGKFALLAELGFDGVELDGPSELDPDEVLAARDEVGLAIPGIVNSRHWQEPFSHPDEAIREKGRAAMETALRDAHRYGASTVLLVPGVVREGVASYEQAWDRSIDEVRRFLPLAEELGVRIAFENVWNDFITEPEEAARYVDAFESDQVGWYFDVGNCVRYGDPAEWARVLGKRTLKLDVKGYSNALREADGVWAGFKTEIGDDDCRWGEVMAVLDEHGIESWATAEVAGGDRERLADIAARMDRVLQA